MCEGVHRIRPQLLLLPARHRLRIGDHQLRADHLAHATLGAGRQAVDPGHLGPREGGGYRRDPGAADRGDRLRRVDDATAAESDDLRRADTAEQSGGQLGHLTGGDGVHRRGSCLQLGGGDQGTGRGQQLERPETLLPQKLRGLPNSVPAKDDNPSGVAPDEVAVHPALATRGLITGRNCGSTSARRCS